MTENDTNAKPKRRPRPVLAARALVVDNDRALFLRASQPGRTYYFLPGGGAKHNEDLAQTAKREVLEETGVRIVVERPLYLREFIASRHNRLTDDMPADRHVVALVFLCRPDPDVHGEHTMPGEFPGAIDGVSSIEDIEWLSRDEIEKVEIMPPHLKRELLADFPPKADQLVYWPDHEGAE